MSKQEPRCNSLKATDGLSALDCDKTNPHLIHRDNASGKKFVRAPGGVVAWPKKKS